MKPNRAVLGALVAALFSVGCAQEAKVPTDVALKATKDCKDQAAQGKAVIDPTGTQISIEVTGLDPAGVYTAFFVNPKSQMFEGVGPAPHVLAAGADGTCTLTGPIEKGSVARFVRLGIYSNPGGKPLENPVGVKTTLGPLLEKDKPKLILEGKLR